VAPTTTAGSATTTEGSDTTTGGSDTTTAPAAGVSGAESDLGTILVDPAGFTLYVFTQDTGSESTCYDDCATLWPPVPGDTAISPDLDASMFGTTTRTDGTAQLTVDGQPLYLYTPDTNPGDVLGQDFGGVWFVVGTNGVMIGGPEGAPIDEGY
jgi:predicted lipoprotein with Yx(FWY)xxD motif